MAKVLPCHCTHRFQDQICGHGKRLHNRCKQSAGEQSAGEKVSEWRCTVCGTIKKGQVQEEAA